MVRVVIYPVNLATEDTLDDIRTDLATIKSDVATMKTDLAAILAILEADYGILESSSCGRTATTAVANVEE